MHKSDPLDAPFHYRVRDRGRVREDALSRLNSDPSPESLPWRGIFQLVASRDRFGDRLPNLLGAGFAANIPCPGSLPKDRLNRA